MAMQANDMTRMNLSKWSFVIRSNIISHSTISHKFFPGNWGYWEVFAQGKGSSFPWSSLKNGDNLRIPGKNAFFLLGMLFANNKRHEACQRSFV
jgi:hypothetical protein